MTANAQELFNQHADTLNTHLSRARAQAATMPPGLMLEPEQRHKLLFSRNDVGLYIHYPFCVQKCPYCDFASIASGEDSSRDEQYVNLLISEFELKLPLLQGRSIVSVYIGGGTPSLCQPAQWARLFEKVGPYLAPGAEVSLEANPGTVDLAKMRELRAAGFNRISIGVQSFNDRMLSRLGRIHNGDEARAACRNAVAAGFYNYNLDIMHGLPRQDVEQALDDLLIALQLESTHLSWYELTLEEGTVFGERPPVLPDEDVLLAIEEQGFDLIDRAGFEHYEVSGYNLGGAYRCVHNQNYWLYGDYLGIGAAAHQKITLTSGNDFVITRSANPENYQDYLNWCIQGQLKDGKGVRSKTVVESGDIPFEFMLNRLRLFIDRVDSGEYQLRTGMPVSSLKDSLTEIAADGLIELEHDLSFSLTQQGKIMLNDVIARFL